MNDPTHHPADRSLSDWIEAFTGLKAAQTLVKSAGKKSTPAMREDVDRQRRCAENALKNLQTMGASLASLDADGLVQRHITERAHRCAGGSEQPFPSSLAANASSSSTTTV